MILILPFLVLVLLVALVLAAVRRATVPLRSPIGRGVVLGLAGLGAALTLVASSRDFWEVTEAENVVTDQYVVGSGNGVVALAIVGALAAAASVVHAAVARRSFTGAVALVAWLLLGATWFGYWLDDSSSRSSAELRDGPGLLTGALLVSLVAALIRWVVATIEARQARQARHDGPDAVRPPPPDPAGR